ncbi:MAG: GNAT family N-acetyltransferase [Roseovarius sp.]
MSSAVIAPRPTQLAGTLSDWRRVLGKHYARLGQKSRQFRFMANLPDQSVRMIAERASPDIVLGIEDENRVVGVLEVFRGTDAHAEIGISVEDAYQGRGYGRALFLDGLAAAERIGVRTADLYFSCENRGIHKLVTDAGGQVVRYGADCEAHIDISRCASCRIAPPDRTALPPPVPLTRRLDHD